MEKIIHSQFLTELRFSGTEDRISVPAGPESVPGLRLTSCVFTPCPVFQTESNGQAMQSVTTANGEVTYGTGLGKRFVRMTRKAVLQFSYAGHPLLSGLGQHENGIRDYADREETLVPHNMKIPVPFLMSSDAWAVWIRADCPMRYEPLPSGFRFSLEAADAFSVFFFSADSCAEILKAFVLMNGRPLLPPRWAFGYIQSKERYRSADELISTVREFRKRDLPLDCIVLDWMSWKDGCWGDKTPDPERFPSVRMLTDKLHALGVRLMVSVWPNMSKGDDCDEFTARDLFLPGTQICDAFDSEARDLYWRQCRRFWMDGGADALWCDSCEPITDPDWCGREKRSEQERYRLLTDASSVCMDPARSVSYGSVHTAGISSRWQQDFPEKRPMILSRSGGADSAANGVILWSGDICARWDVLRAQVTEAIRSSDSGLAYWTLDIGAFFVARNDPWFCRGDYPDGVNDSAYRELYIRWFQFGAMLPFFRSHGTDTPREPWRFGSENSPEYKALKDALALRYRLIPYLYSTAYRCRVSGLPMLRSLLVAFGGKSAVSRCSDAYMLGESLLIKPVTAPLDAGGRVTGVSLPEGPLWYDLFTGSAYPGGETVLQETPLDRFPLFVAAGSVLPLSAPVVCTDDLTVPASALEIFAGQDGRFDLYFDDGDGNGYLDGAYCVIPLIWTEHTQTLRMEACSGAIRPEFTVNLTLRFPSGQILRKNTVYRPEGIQITF